MGKRVIAETGAGQHGVALATAAAYFGLECEIHMGEVDIAKHRMSAVCGCLGPRWFSHARTQDAERGGRLAFSYLADYKNSIYCIGSVVGPHPFR